MKNEMNNKNEKKVRVLTEKEIRRVDCIRGKINAFVDEGYKVTELTISQVRANVLGIAFSLIPVSGFAGCWFLRNSFSSRSRSITESLILAFAFILSIFVHEGIHGLFFGAAAKDHFKSIEFGMTTDMHTPYCTCTTPLSRLAYCVGMLMPGIILGIIPCAISIFNGNFNLLLFGCTSILAAAGDLLSTINLLRYKSSKKSIFCIDHPTEIGFMMIEK